VTPEDFASADFVLACLRGDEAFLRARLREGVDFSGIVEFAVREEVVPRLADMLASLGDLIPSDLQEALADHGRRTAAHNARLIDAAAQIGAAFARQGCPVIFAKGPFFAALIGDDDRRRLSKDLDIYVRRTDVRRAYDLLCAIGFDEEHYPLEETLGNSHHHGMYSAARDATVELHWGVAPAREAVRMDLERLLDRPAAVEIDGTSFPTPHRTDLLLFLAVESEKDGWRSLKKLLDMARLAVALTPSEAATALGQVEAARKIRVLAVALNLTQALGLARLRAPLTGVAAADPTAARIARSVVESLRRGGAGRSLGFLLRHEVLLAQKHARAADRLRHLGTVSLRHAVERWRRRRPAKD
jgi:hypothetical protein